MEPEASCAVVMLVVEKKASRQSAARRAARYGCITAVGVGGGCSAGAAALAAPLPLGLGTFVRPFSDAADGKSPLTAGADNGGASPAHVLAPPRPPMMRAHQPALPLAIRAVP